MGTGVEDNDLDARKLICFQTETSPDRDDYQPTQCCKERPYLLVLAHSKDICEVNQATAGVAGGNEKVWSSQIRHPGHNLCTPRYQHVLWTCEANQGLVECYDVVDQVSSWKRRAVDLCRRLHRLHFRSVLASSTEDEASYGP